MQKAGERREHLTRNKAARVHRLKTKSKGSFQDVHKKKKKTKTLYFAFLDLPDFASQELGI